MELARSPTRPRIGHLLLLVPLVALVLWVAGRGRTRSEDSADVLKALRAAEGPVLPEAAAAGALSRSDVSRYDKETLYELIDGAAEAYLADGFQECRAAVYAFDGKAAGRPLELSAEVHRFANETGAAARLKAETPPAALAVDGLPEVVADGSLLLARVGRDVLKLTVLTPGVPAERPLASVASAFRQEARP